MRSTRRRETILKGFSSAAGPRVSLHIYLSIIGSRLDRFHPTFSPLLNSEVKNEMKNLTKSN